MRNLQNHCPESAVCYAIVTLMWKSGRMKTQNCNRQTLHFMTRRTRGLMPCCSGSKTKRSSHAMFSPLSFVHSLCSLCKKVGSNIEGCLCCSSKSRFVLKISINFPHCSLMTVKTSLFYQHLVVIVLWKSLFDCTWCTHISVQCHPFFSLHAMPRDLEINATCSLSSSSSFLISESHFCCKLLITQTISSAI